MRAEIAGFVTLAVIPACAASSVAAERHHQAHEHGRGVLNVALEEGALQIELIAPGADIVGFEHAAASEADREAVRTAVEILRDGSGLFVIPEDAQCSLSDVSVESELLEGGEDAGEHVEERHAEFRARYRFDCASPEDLDAVELRYFDHFPAARELAANVLTDSGQTTVDLTPDAARLGL